MNITHEHTLDRLLRIHELAKPEYITEKWNGLPPMVRKLFNSSIGYSDSEVAFVFAYVRYYSDSRRKPIAEQLFWTVKYAFAVAPVVCATPVKTGSMQISEVGTLIEYAFNSIRVSFVPDVSDYDPDVVRGSIIIRLLGQSVSLGHDSQVARDIGASWELATKHWDAINGHDAEYVQSFLQNLRQGGSIHLADGIL